MVEAVRDDHRVAPEVPDHDVAGRLGHGDPRVDLLDQTAQGVAGHLHGPGAGGGGVVGRDHRGLGEPQRLQRDRRGDRLVQVDQVEATVAEPAPDPGGGHRSEADPGDRPVVRHRQGRPGGGEVEVGVERREVAGGEHRRVVPESAQAPRPAPARGSARRRDDRRSTDRPARPASRSRRQLRPGEEPLQHRPVLGLPADRGGEVVGDLLESSPAARRLPRRGGLRVRGR